MKSSEKPKSYKILVAGHFGAGKTTFVRTLSQIPILETEKKTTLEEEKSKKSSTTVAMDFGEYITEEGMKIHVFGIPGQERFSFMWPILARNTVGFIYMLDSTDSSRWQEVFQQINLFRKISPDAPFIFVANKQDLPNAMSVEEIRKKLKLPENIKIVPCVATDKEKVLSCLEELLKLVKEKFQNQEKVS
jgi:small GTP-binding protein